MPNFIKIGGGQEHFGLFLVDFMYISRTTNSQLEPNNVELEGPMPSLVVM